MTRQTDVLTAGWNEYLDQWDAVMWDCSRAMLRAWAWYQWNSLQPDRYRIAKPIPDTRYLRGPGP